MIYIVLWWAKVCGSTKIEPKFVVHVTSLQGTVKCKIILCKHRHLTTILVDFVFHYQLNHDIWVNF